MDIKGWIMDGISYFFAGLLEDMISFFGEILANVMGLSKMVLDLDLVNNGIKYAQTLAFTLLVLKTLNDIFQTYILYQNGDSDADPGGLLVRTAQAIAIIAFMPQLVRLVFDFGSKVASDVAGLGTGKGTTTDMAVTLGAVAATGGLILVIILLIMAFLLLIIAIQAAIRGGELALVAVLGPIMALNLTSNNRSLWNAWFKRLVVICVSQALQIFMITGAMSLMTTQVISGGGALLIVGWVWVSLKTPKFLQEFAYSTGFTSAVGGAAKQAGSIAIMRMMSAAK